MLKGVFVTASGALAVAVFVSAVAGQSAMAAAPKCQNKANKYAACTDRLKANTTGKKTKDKQLDVESWSWGSSSTSKRLRMAK